MAPGWKTGHHKPTTADLGLHSNDLQAYSQQLEAACCDGPQKGRSSLVGTQGDYVIGKRHQRQLPIDFAESLISAIEKREELYNVDHEAYKNRNATEMAWSAVAREVGRDVKYCRSTWSQLRATYNRLLAHVKVQSRASRASRPPKWYLYHQMEFLKDHVVHGTVIDPLTQSPAIRFTGPQTSTDFQNDETSHASMASSSTSASWRDDDNVTAESHAQEKTPQSLSRTEEVTVTQSLVEEQVQPSLSQKEELTVTQSQPQEEILQSLAETEELDFSLVDPDDHLLEGTSTPAEDNEEVVVRSSRKKKKSKSGHLQIRNAFLDLLHAKRLQCEKTDDSSEDEMTFFRFLLPLVREMTPRNRRLYYQKILILCNEMLDSQDE